MPQEPVPPPGYPPLPNPRFLTLRDGRRLCYAEWGMPRGRPVLVFHGLPGSRYQYLCNHDFEEARKMRVITVDRPGLGQSDPLPGRKFLDWPADVVQLLDHLGIDRIPIVGISGGGPYALACGRAIPKRITRIVLQGSMAPRQVSGYTRKLCLPVRVVFRLARSAPGLLHGIMPMLKRGQQVATPFGPPWLAKRFLPTDDLRLLATPEIRYMVQRDALEASQQGVDGVFQECLNLVSPWDFDVAEVQVPVRLFHGELDTIVPVTLGRYLARALPRCQATFFPDRGHFMVFEQIHETFDSALAP